MQRKQATGLDTRMLVPVYAGIFILFCQFFKPWISIPMLKRCRLPITYTVFSGDDFIRNLQAAAESCNRVKLAPFTPAEVSNLLNLTLSLKIGSLLVIAAMVWVIAAVLIQKTKSKTAVRIGFFVNLIYCLYTCALGLPLSHLVNQKMGRPNTFFNLSIHSELQITSWVYGQILLSIIVLCTAGRFLSLREPPPQMYTERTLHQDHKLSRRTWLALAVILLAIPLVILFGIYFLGERSNVFIGLCIVCLAMLPFAMVFEDRKPQARELLIIAVMAGLAVVGRMAFFMLPQFKPTAAIVIIAGIGLGAEAGFLTGAVSGFVSNFFFGQGPWTPFQMFAFGIIGFLAGILFHRNKWLRQVHPKVKLGIECLYGGLATLVIYGLIMDASGILTMTANGISWAALFAKIASGFVFNLIHATSTVLTLFLLAQPMEKKLDRIKKKYGILEA